jgi:hypothetical protein
MYFQSGNPDVSNNRWGSLSHDQTGFVIDTGANTGAGTVPATIDNYLMIKTRSAEMARFSTDSGGLLFANTKKTLWRDAALSTQSINDGYIDSIFDTGYRFATSAAYYSLNLDGTDEYAERDQQVVSAYPFTMACWVKTTMSAAGILFFIGDKDVTNIYYEVFISGGKAYMSARNTTEYQNSSTATFNNGLWHSFVCVFRSATNRELYVDGVSVAIGIDSVAYGAAVDRYCVGRRATSSPGYPFTGSIRDVRVWDIDILAAGIAAYHNGGYGTYRGISTSDTVLWLKLTEGTGATAADSSGNGWDATLYNMEAGDWVLHDYAPSVDIFEANVNGITTGKQITSTLAIGTAPFAITSTTLCTNLNADLLDSQQGSYYLDSANFTGTNWTDLTDGGATTLHTHDGSYYTETEIDSFFSSLTIGSLPGPYIPQRIRQATEPTPSAGELMLWSDSDDNKVYLLYNDANAGVVGVELT